VVGRQSLSHFDSLVRPRAPFHRSNSFAIGHLSKDAWLRCHGRLHHIIFYGLTVWIWSLLLTYTLWGGFGVVIGILMGGVGIVPLFCNRVPF
jgi:hypothetical protein